MYLFFLFQSKLSREQKNWTPSETWSEVYHLYLVVVGVETLDDDDDVDAELEVEALITK